MSNVTNLAEAREARRHHQPHLEGGKGFALFHRKIMECGFYKDSQAVHLWVHLILSANSAIAVVDTDYGPMTLQRGQFIGGRKSLARDTGIPEDRVQYLLKKFSRAGMISTFSPGKFTVITLEKYSEYQGEIVPEDSQNIPKANSVVERAVGESFPEDSQKIPTNNNITNNSLSKDKESVVAAVKPEQKKPTHSCQDVIDAYHRILPECPSVRALSDKRKNLIKTFWVKAGKITRQLDSMPFSMKSWEEYLTYISINCRWMLGARPDAKTGKMWRCKNIDYLLSDEVYLKVREGNSDDV